MSLHENAARVLKEWPAPAPDQEQLRLAYLDHLATHPDGMWKPCGDGHLTASALVIDPSRGRVLLTLHKKLRMWLQMGGHCEPGDATLADAALREAREESGIAQGLTLLPGGPVRLDRHHTPCAWHLDVQYAALAPEGATEAISDESLDLRWFPYDEVPDVADESVVRLMERTRALL
ncbi:NUDIX hydrolase [Streptomyces purpurogeneiscleroticus]|uniref:NUDIX hydrolase n=1 Tax=Streptomyces purpurogeneiscleroticus TaxID=68259 RepID=UPI001CC06DE7|nr:NUDIX hydrolase [Streptomyces purpurogeneiscleroticus]MBZ4020818.1 NUDIX hydrolase [Streptomyces purpurogeneiscleroticus]